MLNSFLKVLTEVYVDTGLDALSITCITQLQRLSWFSMSKIL